MYNLLIVEDDRFIADSLKNQLALISGKLEAIHSVANGEEAVSFLRGHHVDIIITDMKMPVMDGVELIERLRRELYTCKIIVLSGYSSFDYAQSVIRHDISEYLLKPVTKKQLEKALDSVIGKLEKERSKRAYVSELEAKLEKQIPVLIDKYLYEACYGKTNAELSRLLKLDRPASHRLLLFSLDKSENLTDSSEKDSQLRIIQFVDSFNDYFRNGFQYNIFTIDGNICVLLAAAPNHSNLYVEKTLKEFQRFMNAKNNIHFSIGISKTFIGLDEMHLKYKQAGIALRHKQYHGKDSLIFYDNIAAGAKNKIDMDISNLKDSFYELLNQEDYDAIENLLKKLKQKLVKNAYKMDYIKTICIEILAIINRYAYECDINPISLSSDGANLNEKIIRAENVKELFKMIDDFFAHIKAQLQKNSEDIIAQRVSSIKKMINDNICGDLTLEKISEKIYLTPNYIGTIFKQYTGVSFKEYLKKAKIAKAKKLLIGTHLKIYEISEQVGYKSVTYFSKRFKEYTGYLPSEYRQAHSS